MRDVIKIVYRQGNSKMFFVLRILNSSNLANV